MHPYIILLLLPVIGIVVFWLLPLPLAIVAYTLILLLSGVLYWVIARAMRKSSKYDMESLVGTEARVVSKSRPEDEAQYMVRVRGELWRANSSDSLERGDTVKVLSVSGLTLQVGKTTGDQAQARNP